MTSYDNNARWDITLNAEERNLVIRALLSVDAGEDANALNSINAIVNDIANAPNRIITAENPTDFHREADCPLNGAATS